MKVSKYIIDYVKSCITVPYLSEVDHVDHISLVYPYLIILIYQDRIIVRYILDDGGYDDEYISPLHAEYINTAVSTYHT